LTGQGPATSLVNLLPLPNGFPFLKLCKAPLRHIKAFADSEEVHFTAPDGGPPRPSTLLLDDNAAGKSPFLRCAALTDDGRRREVGPGCQIIGLRVPTCGRKNRAHRPLRGQNHTEFQGHTTSRGVIMPPPSATLFLHLRRLASPPLPDAELLSRWVRRRDEDAFTALVVRHGPMVLGVCLRVLHDAHAAEDAMQAAFLVLARKAASLRHPEALTGWLHGVAVRVARKARPAARHRPAEPPADAVEPADPHPEPLDLLSAREVLALIDDEIARLPEAYRLALVVCDLQERTQPEAARLLGWTPGALRGRLLRGRARLRQRLARRGVAPAVLAPVLTAGLLSGPAQAVLPPTLARGVTASAARFLTSRAPEGVAPRVAGLARTGMRGLLLARLKAVVAALVIVLAAVAGVGFLGRPAQPAEEPPPPPAAGADAAPPGDGAGSRPDADDEPLPAEAVARLGTTRLRHGEPITSLAFAPDGKTLVSCGQGDGIRVWDAATGRAIARLPDPAPVRAAAVSPDGKWLATLLGSRTPGEEPLAVYEFATGRLVRRLDRRGIRSTLLFAPHGNVLAVHGRTNTVELWDPGTGRLLHTLKGHQDVIWSIAFSPDGKTLVSAGDDRTLRFWDVATGAEVRQLRHTSGVWKLALSPDGRFLAAVDVIKEQWQGGNGTSWRPGNCVHLWAVETGQELRQLVLPAKEVAPGVRAGAFSLEFAPDGRTLVTGGVADGTLRIWDPATGQELRQITDFTGTLVRLAFAPDGKRLAVGHGNTNIRLIELPSGKDLVKTTGHGGWVSSLAVSPDGRVVVTTGGDGTLRTWDPTTGRELRRQTISAEGSHLVEVLPGGTAYLTFGSDKIFRMCDAATGKELAAVRGSDSYCYAVSPDRRTFAAWGANEGVRLVDLATGAPRHTLASGEPAGMAFTADGRLLVVWGSDRTVTVWDVATGTRQRQFAGPGRLEPGGLGATPLPYVAALSPDGELLAFGLQAVRPGPTILPVVETATGKEVCRFTAGEDGVGRLTFAPDGQTLTWAGWRDGTVYLGEIATGRERRHFSGHRGTISSLAFSADGKLLVSGSGDATALVWDLTGRLAAGDSFGKRLAEEELKSHWATLAGADAAACYRAMQALAADPARAVPFLREGLRPVAAADEDTLTRLLANLGSAQFDVRERATAELERLGEQALPAVRKALDSQPGPEARRRLEQLLEKQERARWSPSPDQLRTRRALEVLERAGTPEARRVLETLAAGAPGARITQDARGVLARLSRRP
jgi:RNA polymerase sigma factor (sigma-70 family)